MEDYVIYMIVGIVLYVAWTLVIRGLLKPLRQAFFAWVFTWAGKGPLLQADPVRKELFQGLHDMARELGRPLKLMDLGTGYGPNLKFYPEGTRVVCVDPSTSWDKYLQEFVDNSPQVKIEQTITASAENLSQIKDNSMDAVVTTLVLCSVEEVDDSLKEIRRVLKPGGRYYFLEHIQSDGSAGGYVLWTAQKLVKYMWAFLLDDCQIDRPIWRNLQATGFSELNLKRRRIYWGSCLFYPMSIICLGYGTK